MENYRGTSIIKNLSVNQKRREKKIEGSEHKNEREEKEEVRNIRI
jgi:hypothetical protein